MLIIAVIFSFRDALSNVGAFLQILTTKQISKGDLIKLETGQEGYVREMGWRMTQLKGLNGQIVLIPNSKLARSIIARYHRPLPKAKQPFHFYTRLLLRELTVLSALASRNW